MALSTPVRTPAKERRPSGQCTYIRPSTADQGRYFAKMVGPQAAGRHSRPRKREIEPHPSPTTQRRTNPIRILTAILQPLSSGRYAHVP
ncbi:hypothetical protein BDW67DRAFT_152681 [Aspergillus spinulosporus]